PRQICANLSARRCRVTPTLNVAETPTEAVPERILVTAMVLNPLVSLDRTQLLAAAGRVGIRALLEPQPLGRVVTEMAGELVDVARGKSERAPEAGDKRWADPAFKESGYFKRLMQSYLAWRAGITRIIDEVGLDPKSRERGRFALSLVTEALAPTNFFAGN